MSKEIVAGPEKNVDLSPVHQVCKEHEGKKGDLLIVLQKIQTIFGYVPGCTLPIVSRALGATPSEIFGVLTFYNRFHLSPRGKHTLRACRGTACHFRGSAEIIERIAEHLGLGKDKDTSDDGLVSMEEVACLGACGLAPVMTIDEDTFGRLTPELAVEIIDRFEAAQKKSEGA